MDAGNTGDTHYKLVIAAPSLAGKSRVAAHREIYAVLQPEFDAGLHALNIVVQT